MNVLGYLQKLGKALMLPIAVLPVAALLLRLGQPDLLGIPFMAEAGNAIFSNLPLLFAMGIAVGLSKDGAGAAALAGAVGYFVLTAAAGTINPDINMSFFGGIIAGIVAGHSYNRFHATQLPQYLGFFSGKRLVPIMTGLIILVVAWVAGYVWPFIQNGIDAFGHGIAESGSVGHFLYGTLNRGLIPFGLHHVLNSYFWFGLGDFTNAAGDLVTGDLNRFFAGDPTAGVFMAGFFPVMMFGLPGAALAMYLTAKPEKRNQVGGVLFSVALTSFLTGITEPLEFMFMFMAPLLYVVHAVLTGLSLVLANAFNMMAGFGFSAGLFDMVLNWGLATNPVALVILGLVYFAAYFGIFYTLIRVLNLKTPGREDDDAVVAAKGSSQPETASGATGKTALAQSYAQHLGGWDNLTKIDACITRLRLTLKDTSVIDEAAIKALGAAAVVRIGSNNIQVVIGPEAEIIADEMKVLSPAV
ncbi:N-acetylglucosamine-specific PTS transporter subunit IIBC [Reinekea blandensis]|uniref:PTS system, N-acetylglucosamine-specific IIABC component n=1 Tax=Reinekea blandensis MED297 TaxID=314283 RepID=A4BDK3_9GAMM|nr:N-acetylglucosamine-specific PTS transporter subunit IIBC [Reinekea blandensis]EAR09947.1 PTS system, N-acetylglucosamine-specific IIABC component [Reinekea sp. MED297] [Reinekea blandensis MED297]